MDLRYAQDSQSPSGLCGTLIRFGDGTLCAIHKRVLCTGIQSVPVRLKTRSQSWPSTPMQGLQCATTSASVLPKPRTQSSHDSGESKSLTTAKTNKVCTPLLATIAFHNAKAVFKHSFHSHDFPSKQINRYIYRLPDISMHLGTQSMQTVGDTAVQVMLSLSSACCFTTDV